MSRVVVNLAAAGAFAAMTAARAAGCEVPFWGCLARPGEPLVVPLGPIEPTPAPLDPERVRAAVAARAGRRILTAGADADRLIALRQRLAKDGMSVSIAWDAKQADGLLDMLTPDVAVIDLGLPPRGGQALVVRLGALDPPPLVVLVVPEADPADGFLAVAGQHLRNGRLVPRQRLIDRLRDESDPPPPRPSRK
ncbi:MAG TPA: hypothetical protein VKA21_14140 [Candidatus Binatia bacterium]|nr:hypothetical protein [Candidatus Binatia bacterium]